MMRVVGFLIAMTALAACSDPSTFSFVEEILDDAPGAVSWNQIRVSPNAVCALTQDGKAYCWGQRAGVANPPLDLLPVAVPTSLRFDSIAVGGRFGNLDVSLGSACGITNAKTLH